jgi:hypothetical protein
MDDLFAVNEGHSQVRPSVRDADRELRVVPKGCRALRRNAWSGTCR